MEQKHKKNPELGGGLAQVKLSFILFFQDQKPPAECGHRAKVEEMFPNFKVGSSPRLWMLAGKYVNEFIIQSQLQHL